MPYVCALILTETPKDSEVLAGDWSFEPCLQNSLREIEVASVPGRHHGPMVFMSYFWSDILNYSFTNPALTTLLASISYATLASSEFKSL